MANNREIDKRLKEAISCLEQARLYLYNPYEIEKPHKENIKGLISCAKQQLLTRDIDKLLGKKHFETAKGMRC